MRCLITGTAGFIGFHLARRLLATGHTVAGVDGMTSYYDVALKRERHARLCECSGFKPYEFMLEDASALTSVMDSEEPEVLVHLAAQAGVRYSIENPQAYISSNLIGTFNILEACRARPPRHLLLASTSSVYGANRHMPFRETDQTAHQLTLYAATKQSTEHMAHTYAHLWQIPTTVFRFFTVYGPWGRPDMALFLFVSKMLKGEPIQVFNNGNSERDFTYVDDLVEAIARLIDCTPSLPGARATSPSKIDTLSPVAPFRVVNIGGGQPVKLSAFIDEIEQVLGLTAVREYHPLPQGDVERTFASADLLVNLTGYRPSTPVRQGVENFVRWYREFYSA